MKKHLLSLSIAVFLLWLNPAWTSALAQQDDRCNSNFGFSIEGGFSHLFFGPNLNPLDNYATPSYGGGAGATFFYELQYKHFLFRTGFGVNYSLNTNRFKSPNYDMAIKEYPTMTYHYNFSNFRETTTYGVGYVPVYFGGLFNRFFFLVGAKIGVLPFYNFTWSNTDLAISATDNDIIDPLENISTHQMGNYSLKSQTFPIDYNRLNVMGSLEFGINLDKYAWAKKDPKQKVDKAQQYRDSRRRKSFKERQHYRLSFFLDYGCMNMFSYRANPVPNPETMTPDGGLYAITGVSDVTPGSMFGYAPHANGFLHNMMFGIKFAMMCEVPHKAPKKGSQKHPYIYTYVSDELTGKPLAGALVRTQSIPQGKRKPSIVEKETDAKRGRVMRSYPAGEYIVSVSRSGYFPQPPFNFTHQDDYDTLHIALYPHRTLRTQVVDAKTGRPVPASVTLTDQDGKQVASGNVDSLSQMLSTVVDDRKQLTLCASAKGYKDTCVTVANVSDIMNVQLEPRIIKRFVLKNLLFATDKTKILPSSKAALNELYRMLKENPDIRIRIVGHTDDTGRDEYNYRLSVGRANSVKREMVNRGIAPSRIETAGRGEKDPIVKNDSERHRQMNRRVEIEILGGASIDTFIQNERDK